MLSRRGALKGIGSAVAAAGFGTSVAAADGASSDTEPRDFTDHRTLEFGDDLKRLGRNWIYVAGPSEQVYNYIGKGDAGPSKQRALKSAYKDIERQYPVVRRSVDDNTTQIALADDAASPDALSRAARSRLGEIATAVSQGSAAADGSDFEANWYKKIHYQTAKTSAELYANYPEGDRMWEKEYGDPTKPASYYPDKRDTNVPDAVKDELGENLSSYLANIVQSFLHYRNPVDSPFDFNGDLIPDEYVVNNGGIAHIMAQLEMNKAVDKFESYRYTDAYKRLGYASHYMADVANPLHTGMEFFQGADYVATVIAGGGNKSDALHYRHEGHVNNKWSDWFKSEVQYEFPYDFTGSVSGEIESLAAESQNDASTVFYDVLFKSKSDWTSDLRDLNENRLAQTVAYTKGMIQLMESF
jgi:hypothetical protein